MGVKFGNKCDERHHQTVSIASPIGPMVVTVCSNGLHRLSTAIDHQFVPNPTAKVEVTGVDGGVDVLANPYVNDCIEWLSAYFRNDGHEEYASKPVIQFCPFVTNSEFYQKVWHLLRNEIPFGRTISYGELAALSGNERASRAVGSAMRNNPFLLMVPCHRVINKDGTIGNFSGTGGPTLKQWLLAHESHQ
ncbi:unnamed protein product [Oppiella nova]|uniref:Methylated-DNA--protein-cysteine methyltransferase n=1 Tax=Oppiella nova TaxID=334625 RepID=A0A7R9R041_9ACAR|nr:unnamed protein product [Oppiella nova]CAG2182081.1 unnamed protein product [Oppiella nova]